MSKYRKISPFSTIMVFLVLTVLGLGLAPRLSLRYAPGTQAPSLRVDYSWPRTAPDVIERTVTAPLEGAFGLIAGVKSIYSVSGNGHGEVRLELDKKADLDMLRFEAATKIRQLYPSFPTGVSYPQISLNRPEEMEQERPILIYSLIGEDSPVELYRYARENLSPVLGGFPGVERIFVRGGNQLEWLITFDADRLRTLGLEEADLNRAIVAHFDSESLGVTRQGDQSMLVRLQNAPKPAEQMRAVDWQSIPLKQIEGALIRLGDVASIVLQEQPPRAYYRINGQNSIRLLAYAERNVNNLELAKDLRREAESLGVRLPATYRLQLEDDTTRYLREELDKIRERSLLSLGILLLFVLLTYRSFRQLFIISLGLLANLGLAFIFYYWLGVELNLYALAGITVSFGLIIDNTIVMVHHLRQQGNLKVFPALLASSLTTVAALAVIFFLPERWRLSLEAFAQVVMINLGVSLAVALWLIPALMEKVPLGEPASASNWKRLRRLVRRQHAYTRVLQGMMRLRPLVAAAVILAFGIPVFLLPARVANWSWYNQTIGSEVYNDDIRPVVNKLLGGTLRLFYYYVYDGSAYRDVDETILYVQASLPQGATIGQMNEVCLQLEGYLNQYDREIRQYTTSITSGQRATFQIFFKPAHSLSFPHVLKARLTAYCANLGGVKWNIYGVGRGYSNDTGGSPPRFRVAMYGYHRDRLAELAERLADKLLAHPRVQEVNTDANVDWWEKDLYQYEMELDREAVARQGLSPAVVVRQLRGFDERIQPDYSLPNNLPVRLVNSDLPRNDLWMLNNRQLPADSTRVQLDRISRLEKRKVSQSIHKDNQEYVRMLEFEYMGGGQFGQKFLSLCLEEMRRELPMGYRAEEDRWSRSREQQRMYNLLLLVMGLIFFISAVMFESLRQAITVLLLIPISFIGIFLTFYLFDFSFDQGGYTSFIMVSGLVVNSLILIINDYNGLRKRRGLPSLRLYVKAWQYKIQPILLTVLSTSLGLIPFLTDGSSEVFWFAFAVGVIGGLVFSLLVITLVTPVFLCKKKEKVWTNSC